MDSLEEMTVEERIRPSREPSDRETPRVSGGETEGGLTRPEGVVAL